MRPKREGKFITRVTVKCPPSSEIIRIDPYAYVSEKNEKLAKHEVDDDDDESASAENQPKVAVSN